MNDTVLIGIAIGAIGLFFVLREFALWYFRINERTTVLKEILLELKKQNSNKPDLRHLPDEVEKK